MSYGFCEPEYTIKGFGPTIYIIETMDRDKQEAVMRRKGAEPTPKHYPKLRVSFKDLQRVSI